MKKDECEQEGSEMSLYKVIHRVLVGRKKEKLRSIVIRGALPIQAEIDLLQFNHVR